MVIYFLLNNLLMMNKDGQGISSLFNQSFNPKRSTATPVLSSLQNLDNGGSGAWTFAKYWTHNPQASIAIFIERDLQFFFLRSVISLSFNTLHFLHQLHASSY